MTAATRTRPVARLEGPAAYVRRLKRRSMKEQGYDCNAGEREWEHGYSGSRPARFEEHLRVLFCRAIEPCCWLALQVTVEERQRVGIDDAVRPLCADRPGEAQSRGERRQQWDVGQVEVEHSGHLHEVTISRQTLEHRPHGGLMFVDLCL